MGYDIHITRKQSWLDDAPEISLAEWLSYVDRDPEMHLDGFAEAKLDDGAVFRVESEGLAVWTAYSRDGVDGNMAWFDYGNGNIVVKNPDKEILKKMWLIARELGATVQGDEEERYDADGNVVGASAAPPTGTSKWPWWKLW